jgi:hypothetical protein
MWRQTGERSPVHWMARSTGSSIGHAVAVLETAQRMEKLSATDQALRLGDLSETQAIHIASAGRGQALVRE